MYSIQLTLTIPMPISLALVSARPRAQQAESPVRCQVNKEMDRIEQKNISEALSFEGRKMYIRPGEN
jgi:hypothetical protein